MILLNILLIVLSTLFTFHGCLRIDYLSLPSPKNSDFHTSQNFFLHIVHILNTYSTLLKPWVFVEFFLFSKLLWLNSGDPALYLNSFQEQFFFFFLSLSLAGLSFSHYHPPPPHVISHFFSIFAESGALNKQVLHFLKTLKFYKDLNHVEENRKKRK